jgi:NADH-quinone oxidoreductase subunit N
MLYPYQVLLNDFFIQHFSEIFLAVYLLSYLVYAVAFTESANLASPNLLSSTNSFSVFVLFTILATISIIIQECGFNTLCCSFFSFFFKFLVIVSSISVLLISKSFLASQNIHKYEYDLLIIFSVLSLIILGSSDDFLLVYLAIELQSLCFYVLATFQRNSEFSTEAGLKYFVLGSFSSGFLLLGFVLTYSTFGTINFESLSRLVESDSNNLAF